MTLIRANDVRANDPIRHGAYVCLSAPPEARGRLARADVASLAQRLELRNEFEAIDGHPNETIAYLRRVGATPGQIADEQLFRADAVVHVAAPAAELIEEFCEGLRHMLGPEVDFRLLKGALKPPNFTGAAMHNFAYANQVMQQGGQTMPCVFLLPLNKTADWWAKDWMEQHTFFLPRYDGAGNMQSEGHALVASPGREGLMRRTYKNMAPAPVGGYEFINYFECADHDAATFVEVMTALRDVARNPEWRYVREGPTWRGRRVARWTELFA